MNRSTRLIVVGLLSVGFVLYAFNFGNALFWDDDDWIVANPAVHELSFESATFLFSNDILAGVNGNSNYYRPVLMLSFAVNWAFGEESPFGYHLVSNLLHIGSAILLYLLLSAYMRSRLAAGVASLFWLIHPLNTEAVTYISGRGDPLSVFLMLSALSLWLVGGGHWPAITPRKPHLWQGGAILTAILAILSRETAVLFPGYLIVFFMAFVYSERFWVSFRKAFMSSWIFVVLSVTYGALRLTVLNFNNTLNWHQFSNIYSESIVIRFWTFLGALFDYFRLAVVPVGLHMERNVNVLTSPLIWPVPMVLALLVVFCWLTIRQWRTGNRLWFFGVAWFAVAFTVASGIIAPINALIYEHWMYAPLVGIAVLIGYYFEVVYRWVHGRSRALGSALIVGAVVYAIFLSVQTVRRNLIWGNTEAFYLQVLSYEPDNNRVLNNLANWYADEDQPDKAEEYWTQAIQADPTHPAPYHNLGNLARDRGNLAEAENLYLLAISKQESFHYAYRNLIAMFIEQKRFQEAAALLLKLEELIPTDPRTPYVLAQVLHAVGETDLARMALERGVPLVRTPEEAQAYRELMEKLK